LYTYLEHMLLWLDSSVEFSNFHLFFLVNLTKHLGFYPDLNHITYPYFNLKEGHFQHKKSSNTIQGKNLELFKKLLGIKFDETQTIKVNAKQRQSFLDMILSYYQWHISGFKYPKSLHIFEQVFST